MEEALDSDLTHETLIHDLNNVFETISEAAELLSADRHWRSLAGTLRRSIARGQRLIGAIPDSTPNLTEVVGHSIQSVNDYCMAARKPRIRFIREFPTELDLPGSANDWERVFVNLFLNAAQIMRKPGRIEISAEQREDSLNITVSDNGPGIPPEILPRVFRPNVSTKSNRSGRSGLGLHIVASIVKKYSGRVAAANHEAGGGAVFTIVLPES
jgi:signal transduction histidine kinase